METRETNWVVDVMIYKYGIYDYDADDIEAKRGRWEGVYVGSGDELSQV
jgi:hypothetical protein